MPRSAHADRMRLARFAGALGAPATRTSEYRSQTAPVPGTPASAAPSSSIRPDQGNPRRYADAVSLGSGGPHMRGTESADNAVDKDVAASAPAVLNKGQQPALTSPFQHAACQPQQEHNEGSARQHFETSYRQPSWGPSNDNTGSPEPYLERRSIPSESPQVHVGGFRLPGTPSSSATPSLATPTAPSLHGASDTSMGTMLPWRPRGGSSKGRVGHPTSCCQPCNCRDRAKKCCMHSRRSKVMPADNRAAPLSSISSEVFPEAGKDAFLPDQVTPKNTPQRPPEGNLFQRLRQVFRDSLEHPAAPHITASGSSAEHADLAAEATQQVLVHLRALVVCTIICG